jgi:hypothetical protein
VTDANRRSALVVVAAEAAPVVGELRRRYQWTRREAFPFGGDE